MTEYTLDEFENNFAYDHGKYFDYLGSREGYDYIDMYAWKWVIKPHTYVRHYKIKSGLLDIPRFDYQAAEPLRLNYGIFRERL